MASELEKLRQGQSEAQLARSEAQVARAEVMKQEGHGLPWPWGPGGLWGELWMICLMILLKKEVFELGKFSHPFSLTIGPNGLTSPSAKNDATGEIRRMEDEAAQEAGPSMGKRMGNHETMGF